MNQDHVKHLEIEKDVLSLLEAMNTLNQLVSDSQAQIDTIENFIEESKHDVQESKEVIETASSYSTYVTGAIGTIGTVIGLFLLFQM